MFCDALILEVKHRHVTLIFQYTNLGWLEHSMPIHYLTSSCDSANIYAISFMILANNLAPKSLMLMRIVKFCRNKEQSMSCHLHDICYLRDYTIRTKSWDTRNAQLCMRLYNYHDDMKHTASILILSRASVPRSI